ncbi:MAG: hypothetical protein JW931_05645 [Methanomicrobiaceae archaeon]|nr:hypothetical protein [Methanomicrobiaceae archaeon]
MGKIFPKSAGLYLMLKDVLQENKHYHYSNHYRFSGKPHPQGIVLHLPGGPHNLPVFFSAKAGASGSWISSAKGAPE